MVEHMDERFRIRFLELEENRAGAFCSGDYSSATDLMHTDATVECIERILENTGLTKTLVGVSAWNSLIGSRIHYGKKDSLLQSNGQLMGHPLSFPILCIINLSTYLRTMEYRSRTDAYLAPVLINGDDILFRGDATTFQKWKSCAADVGLEVNELKTYISDEWALINSRMYSRVGQRIGYANFALAHGYCVKNQPSLTVQNAPAIWDELSNHIPVDVGAPLRGILVRRLNRMLSTYCRGVQPNLFLPRHLGGVGLKNWSGKTVHVTGDQRKLATYYVRHPEEVWLREHMPESNYSCALALKRYRKIRPAAERARPRRIHGPLRKEETWEWVQDNYLACVFGHPPGLCTLNSAL
jgi:hypothetical protein